MSDDRKPTIEVLRSQINYVRWARQFKREVTLRSFEKFFYHPLETLIPDPGLDLPSATVQVQQDGHTVMANNTSYQIEMDTYKFVLKRYEKQQDRYRAARTLLHDCLDPSISQELDRDIQSAFQHIIKQYSPQTSVSRATLCTQLGQLKLKDFANMQAYITAHVKLHQDLESVGGTYTEDQWVAKLLTGLTRRYNRIVENIRLEQLTGKRVFNINDVTFCLLTYEILIKQRKVSDQARSSRCR